jgi:acyl carrier protein
VTPTGQEPAPGTAFTAGPRGDDPPRLRPFISEAQLIRAAQRVFGAEPGDAVPEISFATRLADLEVDSLVVAELIVELEDETDTLLDLIPVARLNTFGDLCEALRPLPVNPAASG